MSEVLLYDNSEAELDSAGTERASSLPDTFPTGVFVPPSPFYNNG